ncbi:MAG: PAS domain-containing protein [Spirochaetaceae bacterium]|jgi:predicted transcriptional regulator YheO|nr:PAS domain-containing protein [Spirochaetaceae bacterium]
MDIMDIAALMVDFLGKASGGAWEIVLQDLRPEKMCIVAIANGHISGRSIGSPPTDLTLRLIAQGVWKTRDYICNYEGTTRDNRPLQSSTFFIKDEGKLLGMLSVNKDVSQYTRISDDILRLAGLRPMGFQSAAVRRLESSYEVFYEDIEGIIKSVFKELRVGGSLERISQAERLAVIEQPAEQEGFPS